MFDIAITLLPILLLLIFGNLLRRNGFPGGDFWLLADKVVYWILFPALLLHNTTIVKLNPIIFTDYAIIFLSALVGTGIFSLIMSKIMRHSPAITGSVFQGAVRHNTFIAFGVAEALIGPEALIIAAVATSVLVAPTNLLCVATLVMLKNKNGLNINGLIKKMVKELIKNPLLIAIAVGLSLNINGIGKLPIIDDTAKILSHATLPFALLCVGAGIHIKQIKIAIDAVIISVIGKFIIFASITVILIYTLGIKGDIAMVAIIYAAIPTAASGYSLARQLGGDAPLMAGIITVETLIAIITMPLMLVYIPQLLQ